MTAQAADALMSIFGFERVTLRGDDESGKTAAQELLEVVMSDKMREEFEEFAVGRARTMGYSFPSEVVYINGAGDCAIIWVEGAWLGWQASRAALVVELPAENDNGYITWTSAMRAIHAAGVKTK